MRPTDPDVGDFLRRGALDVEGRLVDASNATLFCAIEADGVAAKCVYKPVRGERPLWDFPDGTLAGREVGAYLVAEASGLGGIPPTVLRDGPFGPGMVQLWIDTDDEAPGLVDVVSPARLRPGWKAILRAHDSDGEPAVLAHSDSPAIARLAALDVVINNADRKGGHVLLGTDGGVYGVDHGICLHTEHKLRTVLWGWAEEPMPDEVVDALARLRSALGGPLADTLGEHITRAEVRALRSRVSRLLSAPVFPSPDTSPYPIPWPAF
ncbi:SCO1664 family protein [Actinokineospora sp. PR83]|uniref:SCO1664 family protein n=1 Tax=Actinokineospora sp. PR83 TaxID=2884908 RepID=UPI0027DF510E|nr:SCO1664 family protein [Actinokineospora sp. PR83]MCG8918643.1 SCO1664 family protein [Actinokineospora sp. PR83]